MFTFSGGCGEDIHVTAIFYFEAFAQFCNCEWKVARSYIGFLYACQRLAQLALIHRRHALHTKLLPGKPSTGSSERKRWLLRLTGDTP